MPIGVRIACAALAVVAALRAGAGLAADDDHVYRVVKEDTLIGLTRKLLRTPGDWPLVAHHNGLRNPHRITPGMEIRVPLAYLHVALLPVTVSHVQGEASAGAGALAVGARLAEGARVTTGKNGHVTLTLHDGSTVRVSPGSEVEVERQRTYAGAGFFESSLKLLGGRVEALIEKFRGDGAAPRRGINTPLANLTVRGTRYRVAVDGAVRGEVLEGAVAVAGGGAPAVHVDAGFGSVVEQGRPPSAPAPLLAAPEATGLATLQERPVLRFALPAVAGASAYRLQISADEGFRAVVAEAYSKQPDIRIAGVADGRYFLRVRAVDGRGLEGRDAIHAFTLKARPEPPLLSLPVRAGKVRAEEVRLQWAENTEAAAYHVQVSADADFRRLVHEDKSVKGGGVAVKLPLGNYYWRVASLRAGGVADRGPDRGPFGDVSSFALLAPPAIPDPPALSDKEVQFRWAAEVGQRFEFELAQDTRFAQPLLTRRLEQAQITLPKPAPGTYYIRVRATDADGFVGPYTMPQTFTILPPPPPAPPPCLRDSAGQCVGAGSGIVGAMP
jgi:hypothetical protein